MAKRLSRQRLSSFRKLLVESLESRRVLANDVGLVKDINTIPTDVGLSWPEDQPTVFGNIAFYGGYGLEHGRELWRTDGTAAGTSLVKDIDPGTAGSAPKSFVEMNGAYYFVANTLQSGTELWRTDGTEAGTLMVLDINPGAAPSYPTTLTVHDGQLYFFAYDDQHGYEPWKSDGTAAGTSLVKDLLPGSDSSGPSDFIALANNSLLFNSYNPAAFETSLTVIDRSTNEMQYVPSLFMLGGTLSQNDGEVVFVGFNPALGAEFWKSDGTVAGTSLIADLEPNGSSGATLWGRWNDRTIISYATETNSYLATLSDNEVIDALWTSTVSGIQNVKAFGNELLFATGDKLYRTDGTESGTVEIALPEPLSLELRESALLGGDLFIGTNNGQGVVRYSLGSGLAQRIVSTGGYNLQATQQGVYWLEQPGQGNSISFTGNGLDILKVNEAGSSSWREISLLTSVGGEVVVVASNSNGYALRKLSGSLATNLSVPQFGPTANGVDIGNQVRLGDNIFFLAQTGSGFQVWRSDGTESGTTALMPEIPQPLNLVATEDRVFAWNATDEGATQLRVSNGDALEIALYTTLPFTPQWVLPYQGKILLADSQDIWISDGTAAGTSVLVNVEAVLASDQASVVLNGSVYFAAFDLQFGGFLEFWKLTGTDSPSLARVMETGEFYFNKSVRMVADETSIAYITPDVRNLWVTRDGFQTRSLQDTNVNDLLLSGGMLYYTGERNNQIRVIRSDAGETQSGLALGDFYGASLREVGGVVYVNVVNADGQAVLSPTGLGGALEPAADLQRFVVGSWGFDALGGKAIGPAAFSLYGNELGITSPGPRVSLENSVVGEEFAPGTVVGNLQLTWGNPDWGQPTYSIPGGSTWFAIDQSQRLITLESLDFEETVQFYESKGRLTLPVRADFPNGESIENNVIVYVRDRILPLERVRLDNSSILENTPIGTLAGTLTSDALRPNEQLTFELVSVYGTNDLPYRIENNQLFVNGLIDFEERSFHLLQVRVISSLGESANLFLSLTVIDVNENANAPIQLSSDDLLEGNYFGAPTQVGQLSIPNRSELFDYRIDPGWADGWQFIMVGDVLYFQGEADYEQRDGLSVRVVATNAGNTLETITSTFTIDLLPVDEFPPENFVFSTELFGDSVTLPYIVENSPVDQPATKISVIDRDRGETYTFSGGIPGYAIVVGEYLVPTRPINYETDRLDFFYTVASFTATSSSGQSYTRGGNTNLIIDVNDPPIVAVPVDDEVVLPDTLTFLNFESTFSDEDANDQVTVTASYNNGLPLPGWLSFAGTTLTVFPTTENIGSHSITLTATDLSGSQVSESFDLVVVSPIRIDGTTRNDTIRVVANPSDALSWVIFVNGVRTFDGFVDRPVLVSGLAGTDRVIFEGTSSTESFEVVQGRVQIRNLRMEFVDVEAVDIQGRGGSDLFQLSGNSALGYALTLQGGLGRDTVSGPASNNEWVIDGTDSGTLNGVRFTSIEVLQGGSYNDRYTMRQSGRITGQLIGNEGEDSLDYSERRSNTDVILRNVDSGEGDADDVRSFVSIDRFVGAANRRNSFTLQTSLDRPVEWRSESAGVTLLENRFSIEGFATLVGSLGPDVFYLGGSSDGFEIDGRSGADQVQQNFDFNSIDVVQGRGTGLASFDRIESFYSFSSNSEIQGSNQNSRWRVEGTTITDSRGYQFQNFGRIIGGRGNDFFEVVPGFQNFVQVNGGLGNDSLATIKSASDTLLIADWSLYGIGTGQMGAYGSLFLSFNGIENLVTGQIASDALLFLSTPEQVWFQSVTGTPSGNTLVQYRSQSTTSSNSVNPVNDPPVTVNLQNKTASGIGSWDLIQSWTALSVNDRLIGENLNTNWSLSGFNTDSTNGRIRFSGFEEILGGSADDTFQVVGGFGPLPSRVSGGAGRNTLDFSQFNEGIQVDLTARTTSVFAIGDTGFSDVIGTAFEDSITGDGKDNILLGLDGNDVLRGLGGNDVLLGGAGDDQLFGGNGRDLMVGGLGTDLLQGGGDDDILIGGQVTMLTNNGSNSRSMLNRTAINAVMSEWTSNRNYTQRVARLRTGAFRLDSSTILNDSSVDQLFGEAGRDWFWGGAGDTTLDRAGNEDLN